MTAALEVRDDTISEPIPRRAGPVRAALRRLLPGAWVRRAACTPGDHARLDPIVNGRPSQREMNVRVTAARELCAHCPVRQDCADDADAHGDFGVRGGALRHEDGELGGRYVALALIPHAAVSRYDRRRVAAQFYAEQENTS